MIAAVQQIYNTLHLFPYKGKPRCSLTGKRSSAASAPPLVRSPSNGARDDFQKWDEGSRLRATSLGQQRAKAGKFQSLDAERAS